jgi:CubicO group peptidase (beta-lactamase class C family)
MNVKKTSWFARSALVFSLAAITLIGGLTVITPTKVRRFVFVLRLFSGDNHIRDFQHMALLFPTKTVPRSGHPFSLSQAPTISLPKQYLFNDSLKDTASFLQEVDTTGLMILHRDRVIYEQYWHGTMPTTRTVGWSLTKSFVSALIGVAIKEGKIASIREPVTRYVPELAGTAYDGVSLKDVLQMSSGASWNEDYSDWRSDINRFARTFALGGSLDHFITTLKREHPPGTYHRYNSMDTQVLGLVLRRATGQGNAAYLEAKLWQPLGMQDDAFWVTDDSGAEFAAAGLNATLRDFAKLGELYLHGGVWNGGPIIPEAWVKASVTPDAPHLMPGKRDTSEEVMGYGMQWWVPNNRGDYTAIGVFNQFVYVNPGLELVIAKTSANHAYGTGGSDQNDREDEHIAFFQAIEQQIKGLNLN